MSFKGIKTALGGEAVLCALNFDLPFSLQTDALDRRLGAVLTPQVEGADRLVLYLRRKLSDREGRYSTQSRRSVSPSDGGRLSPLLPAGSRIHPLLRLQWPAGGAGESCLGHSGSAGLIGSDCGHLVEIRPARECVFMCLLCRSVRRRGQCELWHG